MTELEQALTGESAHAAPGHILEGLTEAEVHRSVDGAPHTIYQELWHICFWLRMSLDWMAGVETPYPAKMTDPFPDAAQTAAESWEALCERFSREVALAAEMARDEAGLLRKVRCPSRPGEPVRTMSVEDQMISLAAHDSYHFGRIVLLRQMLGTWPPKSGGFRW